jgi:hypothetical protein
MEARATDTDEIHDMKEEEELWKCLLLLLLLFSLETVVITSTFQA